MVLNGLRTLVLDAAYRPMHAVRWQRAMVLDLLDQVDVLEYYDQLVRTQDDAFPLPAVIRQRGYIRRGRRLVALTRRNLLARDEYTCQYCGIRPPLKDLTMDHVPPSSRGAETSWENLVTACASCNRRKGNRTPEEAHLRNVRPTRPGVLSLGRDGLFRHQETPPEWSAYVAPSKG